MPDNLADAKAALASANNFQRSAGGPMSKPAAAPVAPAPKPKSTSLGDEAESAAAGLASKASNVGSYRQVYVDNYKARNAQ